ncbi:MAG: hypothetical protein ACRDL5_09485, partial [Solirubrobacteraceae bacterium]
MRLRLLILAAGSVGVSAVPALAAAPAKPGSLAPVRVTPRRGGAHTRFRVSVRLPSTIEPVALRGTYDTVFA